MDPTGQHLDQDRPANAPERLRNDARGPASGWHRYPRTCTLAFHSSFLRTNGRSNVQTVPFCEYTGPWTVVACRILAILILASVFVRNFWCRYLCPYGALMGLAYLAALVTFCFVRIFFSSDKFSRTPIIDGY